MIDERVHDEPDHELATRLAVEAGQLLVQLRQEHFGRGAPSWQVMDNGDLASHHFLLDELRRTRPDDAVLSEEGVEDPRRFTADRVWIVDPLDGTNEYGEHGRHDWAVHVALWQGGRLTAGAVSLPALDMVFATEPAPVLPPNQRERPRLVTSRTRNPPAAVVVANALDCDAVRLGSAGAKAMAVVVGEADIYVHDGGMYQWDSAAPAVVAEAAGLHVSRIDGSPLVYNQRDPWLPDFLVCRKELAEGVLDALWGNRRRPPAGRSPSRMELTAVRREIDGHVATVWLHRPHRHNAWTGRMHREYLAVMAELADDPAVRAVVVTGTPPAFCVGGDSEALAGHAERGAYDSGLGDERARPAGNVPDELDADFAWQFAMRFPIIAAVNGAAAGVGLALALFCDLRFGSATAKLTTAAPKLGLPAEYGMSWQLPRLVGATRAADLLLSGRVFTPRDTEGWGLWNGVEADGEATLAAAQQYAHHLATGVGPAALSTTKAQLYADLLHHSPARSIREAQRLLEVAMTTAEYREGVAALREKRRPDFG